MGLSLQTGLTPGNGFELARNQARVSSSISRLSSGNRLVRASDDVAFLSISTSLTTRVRALRAAKVNTLQATSLLEVADAGMRQIDGILQRMAGLSTMSNSGSLSSSERGFLNLEFQELKDEIDRIANETNFNGVNLLNRYVDPVAVNEIKTGTEVEDTAAVFLTFDPFTPGSGNAPPVNATPIPDGLTNTNTPYSFTVAGGSFTDPDGDPLTYTASLAGGAPLPGWLSFDAATQTFSGTPTVTDQGVISITVTASDGAGTASDTFDLTVFDPPAPPFVVTPLADQVAGEGAFFSFALPAQPLSFDDPNLDTLIFSTGALPPWLNFDPATRLFSGTPPFGSIGTYNIDVIATDPGGLNVMDSFQLEVTDVNQAPTDIMLAPADVDEDATVGSVVGFLSSVDPDVGDTHTYTLTSDPNNVFAIVGNELRVANPLDFESDASHTIAVRTTDAGGLITAKLFTITVNDVNETPFVTGAITNQTATEAQPFSFSVPATPGAFDDPDGDVLTYSAQLNGGGGLPAWLNFNAATRTFSGTPAPADVGTISIDVTVTDGGGLQATQTFDLVVNEVNDPPINLIDNDAAPNSVNEAAANGTVVNVTGLATDPEADPLTYTLTDNAGGRFQIDGTTGVVTVANGTLLDFETDVSHDITIRATDTGGLFTTNTFTINVNNVNENPFNTGGLVNQTINEGDPLSYIFGAQPAIFDDPDGDALTYSAAGLPVWLSFNPATSEFSGNAPLGSAGTSTITVTATDGGGLFSTQTFDVTVNDLNFAPINLVDTDADANAVLENATNGTIVEVTGFATDPDGDALTYSLTDDAGGRFQIDSTTGVVTVADGTLLDFETAASHNITIQASDGSLTTTNTFTINITDVNENPFNTGGLTDQTVNEGDPLSYSFAVDPAHFDDPDGDALTYSVAGLPAWLNFNAATRTFSGTAALGSAGTSTVTVTATDGGGLFASQTFDMTVTDINNAPINLVDNDADANAVVENAANGTMVEVTGFATDPDGDALTYTLDDNAGGRFAIDGTTGVVTVANGTLLDFEAAASHDITIRATDGGALFTTNTFTINVTDVNETPVVTGGLADQTIAEGALLSYQFGAQPVVFDDPDGDVVTYTAQLNGGGALPAWLSFNAATRTFSGTPANGDVGTISVDVIASDGTLTATDTFDITVTDVNNAPINLVDNDADADVVAENVANGTIVEVTGFATDPDGDALTYSLTDDASGRFTIDGTTGVVTVANGTLLDFETSTSHNITIQASDGSLTTTNTFTINVTDVNETPTNLVDNDADANIVDEGAAAGTVVEVTGLATDVDAGANGALTYSLANDAGGRFTIDGTTGVVTVAGGAVFNYGTNASHDITIRAEDGGGLFVDNTFTINVNATPGAVTDSNATANRVNSSDVNGTAVNITGLATDPDGGALTYSLTNDAGGRFAIDGTTGIVTIANAAAITGTPNSFTIEITATDARGLTSAQTFTININNAPVQNLGLLDRLAFVGNAHEYNINIPNPAGDIAFEDPDGDALTYTVIGAPAWLAFNPATQQFTGTPAAGDIGTTTVTVRATDPFGAFADDTFDIEVRATNGLQAEIFLPADGDINGGGGIGDVDGNGTNNRPGDEAQLIVNTQPVVGNFVSTGVQLGPSNVFSNFIGSDYASLDDITLDGNLPDNSTTVLQQVIRFTGNINVPVGGDYGFAVYSDDGFILRIDGVTIADYDRNRAPRTTEGNANLTAGNHTVELIYWERGGGQRLDFYSTIPSGPGNQSGAPVANQNTQPPGLNANYSIVDDSITTFTPGPAFFDAPTSITTRHHDHDYNDDVVIDENTAAFKAIFEENVVPQNGKTVYYSLDDSGYDDALKDVVRNVMAEYEAAADITFIEGRNPENGRYELDFKQADDGYAFQYGGWIEDVGEGEQARSQITLSSNFYDYQETINAASSAEGSYTRLALMHEIGHFFGLNEPDINLLPDTSYDSSQFTVMSYNQISTQDDATPYGRFTSELGALDIGALQHLYGKNVGDDEYIAPFTFGEIPISGQFTHDLNGGETVESTGLLDNNTVQFFTAPTAEPLPATGDYILINGVPYSFVVGADPNDPTQIEFDTLENMLEVLVNRLNSSVDPRISQASYELANPRTIKIETRAGQDIAELYKVADNLAGLRDFIQVLGGTEVNDFGAQNNYIAEDGDNDRYAFIGSGSVSVAGQSSDDILLSPANIEAQTRIHFSDVPLAGETISIDDGIGGFLDFTFTYGADPLDPFEIEIGDTVQDSLDNVVGKLNNWVNEFGTSENSFVMRELDFEWAQDTLILSGKVAGSVLDYQDALANFGTSVTGATISNNVMDNGLSKGINTDYVANNAFYGTIDNFEARYLGDNQVQMSVVVGDVAYRATINDTRLIGTDQRVRLVSEQNGYFDLELRAGNGEFVTDQADADVFAARVNQAMSSVSFYQERQVLNYKPVDELRESIMTININDFDNPIFFDDVEVVNSSNLEAQNGTKVTITVNGERFTADLQNDTDFSTYQTLTLVNEYDRNEFITINQVGDEVALESADDAATFEDMLRRSLPFGGFLDREVMSFQVNTKSTERLDIDIQAVTSEALFREDNDTINILSQEDARKAFDDVIEAIDELTSRRADVGAFEAQADSILNALNDAISNQSNANAVLADTDIARTSTELANDLAKVVATLNTLVAADSLHAESLMGLLDSLDSVNDDNE